MEDKILFRADRSTGREIRLTLREYQGKPMLDLRNFYLDSSTGEYRPTKQGISLSSPEMVDDLAVELQNAVEALRKQIAKAK